MGEAGIERGIMRAARSAVRKVWWWGSRATVPMMALGLALLTASGCGKSSSKNVIVFWQFSPLAVIQPVLERF